jgi:SAM-dependent MidA family methyltransferase
VRRRHLGDAAGEMTPLETRIREEIRWNGPISVERYIALCLFDPDFGYYTTREPFGVSGDFTTAPEVSQMFGEMLAAWWVSARETMDLPELMLAEIGPGNGTLMQDMLRAIGKLHHGALPAALMVETSPRLTRAQQEKLRRFNANVSWHASPETFPRAPLGIIANELFDAIPAAQYVKTPAGWFERTVCIDGAERLAFGISANRLNDALLPAGHDTQPVGQLFEISLARLAMLRSLARRVKRQGGFALFIDYGHAQPGFGDTLQAVKSQKYAGIFDHPGEADLTSHVDFAALADAARQEGLFVFDIMNQGSFLRGCGIETRAAKLKSAGSAQLVDSALHRLTHDSEMGRLFRVLCVSSAPIDLPPLKIQH